MPTRYNRRILNHMADPRYKARRIRELAEDLGVKADELDAFRVAVDQLVADDQVVLDDPGVISLPPPGREMVGLFRRNDRGFGFIQPDSPMEHGDLFVLAEHTANAMTGDRVRARVVHNPGRGRQSGKSPYTGRILEIIQRGENHYVGNLVQRGNQYLVETDGKLLSDPVIIRDPHAKNASPGDKVVIELTTYPKGDQLPQGVILEVLGEKGLPDVETIAVMRAHGLDDKFPAEVMTNAREASASFDERHLPADRLDLSEYLVFTIDPPDAKDFDDAIHVIEYPPGDQPDGAAFELAVHIADVSHFVTPGSALDEEAAKRGNSTYLPRKVIPMLPETLSNGVCSLQDGVFRLTKSIFIRYDADANVVGRRFANTVIHSQKRLTYLEAQALIDRDIREARKHARTEPKYSSALTDALILADKLAKTIRKRRLASGMIVLGLPEVELEFNEAGYVVDAMPEDNAFTHTLIEMFMVEANERAAELFSELNVAMIRRVHPDPDAHDVGALKQFARVAGYNIPAKPNRQELQQLLDSVRGKPAQLAVHFAVLKTLSKAEYAPDLIGHFALASEHYAHFTSPIRRYADLVLHRALDAYCDIFEGHRDHFLPPKPKRKALAAKLMDDPRVPDEATLRDIGRHCSSTERNSEGAERSLRAFLVLQLMQNKYLGDDFAGTVTGVTGNGVFIQIDRFLVDGFVPAADLPGAGGGRNGDRWRLNRTTGALVAQRSGRTITIGDSFTVRVVRVSPEGRRMEMVIVEGDTDRDAPAAGTDHRKSKSMSKQGGKQTGKQEGSPDADTGATDEAGSANKSTDKSGRRHPRSGSGSSAGSKSKTSIKKKKGKSDRRKPRRG